MRFMQTTQQTGRAAESHVLSDCQSDAGLAVHWVIVGTVVNLDYSQVLNITHSKNHMDAS